MKWLATVDNGTSIETCPYFARTITLVASSVMVLAGQPSIASRKKALSGRVTPLLSKSGCISSPGIPLMLVNLKVAIILLGPGNDTWHF